MYDNNHVSSHTIMRRLLILFICLLSILSIKASDKDTPIYPTGKNAVYRIYLKDKKGTPYSLNKPEKYLSKRAIARRRHQQLPVDSTDLPVSPAYVKAIRSDDVQVLGCSKWNNTVVIMTEKAKAVEKLRTLPFVDNIIEVWEEPKNNGQPAKRDSLRPMDLNKTVKEYYGFAQEQTEMLNGQRLHEMGFKGRGMMIAVLDGGFMNVDTIPALRNSTILGVRDFVRDRKANVFEQLDHGTKVLSLMATCIPNVYVGAAPEAYYWLLRSEDGPTESMAEEDYWAMAVEFADSVGCDVINSSLGYHEYDNKSTNYRYRDLTGRHALISRTASMLADKGIVHVNSGGNSGMGSWKKIGVPADATDILAVGATNKERLNAAYSSVGPSADGRVKPDIVALGNPWLISGRGHSTISQGTSFAAPQICGWVACLWQALPDKTAREILNLVRMSGDNTEYPDNIFGYGMPDFYKAYQMGKGMEN